MHDAGRMGGPQSRGRGLHQGHSIRGGGRAARDEVVEAAAGAQLHDQVGAQIGQLARVHQGDHVRMPRDPRGRLHLTHEPPLIARIIQGAGVHLDGDRTLQGVLNPGIDRGEATAPQH